MKNIIKLLGIVLFIGLLITIILFAYQKYLDYVEQERIKNAIIKVDLRENLELEFNSVVKLSDLIENINGELIDNPIIDTSVVGTKNVNFKYINEEDIKVPYSFKIQIIDTVPPVIWLSDSYSVNVGYDKNLEEAIMCGDNYDDNPKCYITGSYDTNKVGSYKLTYNALDNSGNTTKKDFVLKVTNPTKPNNNTKTIPFKSLYNEYKKDNTKIGIDVSKWQGDIDFQKVKDEGVEFVFIKIGGQNGIGGDYYLDPKFEINIKGFKNVGIPVGLYFYSYANNPEQAGKDALWVIKNIKGKKIDLPIAFDWENWGSYNKFHMSFNTLTKSAERFINTLEMYGYKGMLYGSKNYLENIWLKNNFTTWVAHYTTKTDYQKEYKCWQRTSSAKILGITDNTVDVDICYD